MKGRIHLAALTLSAVTSLLVGCPESETPPALGGAISINVSACLGAQGISDGCRANLDRLDSDSGPVNACVVFEQLTTGSVQIQPARWDNGRLALSTQAPVVFSGGTTVATSIFFLARAGLPPLCEGLAPDTRCNAVSRCALRLGPVTAGVNDTQPTVIDFSASPSGCQTEASATSGVNFGERCDGADNDCDGSTDEQTNLTIEPCDYGVPQCMLPGHFECQEGAITCVPDTPVYEACNGADDDCDGQIDEIEGCRVCQDNADCVGSPTQPICNVATGECRQCLGDGECAGGLCILSTGACGACDPATYRGCPDLARPVCSSAGNQCVPCSSNDECATYGVQGRRVCIDGRCGGCNQGDLRLGCGSAAQPICDETTVTDSPCRGCVRDAECGPEGSNAVCLDDGSCSGCNPATHRGCNPVAEAPICDARTESCGPCNAANNQCSEINGGATPFCLEAGGCGECVNTTSEGCVEASRTPFCANGRCRACNDDGECNRRDGRLNYCGLTSPLVSPEATGACLICSPISHEGCSGVQPICDRDGECRACRAGDNCPNGDICVSGRCVNCDPDDNLGCSNGGAGTPVCNEDQLCDRCIRDSQCDGVWQDAGLTECVNGRCAECSPQDAIPCVDQPTQGCVAVVNGPHVCGVCRQNQDCGLGRFCVNGACSECVPNDPGTCPGEDQVCDPVRRVCIEDGCQADDDCEGLLCVAGECQSCDPIDHRGCSDLIIDGRPGRCLDGQVCVGCLESTDCYTDLERPNLYKICDQNRRCVSCNSGPQCSDAFDGDLVSCQNGKCRLCRNNRMDVNAEDFGCFEPFTRCMESGTECCKPENEGGECLTERPD